LQNRVDVYPIKVTVSADINGTKLVVWSGRQQNLFSKYGAKRAKSMQEIKLNLEDLKEEYDL